MDDEPTMQGCEVMPQCDNQQEPGEQLVMIKEKTKKSAKEEVRPVGENTAKSIFKEIAEKITAQDFDKMETETRMKKMHDKLENRRDIEEKIAAEEESMSQKKTI